MKGEIGVVLVDGDRNYRTMLKERLDSRGGFRVLAAVDDGASALREIREKKPQFVITELILRGMDGLTFLRRLSQEADAPRAIILSDWMNPDLVSAALNRGALYYLMKPCDAESLAEQMEEYLHLLPLSSQDDIDAECIAVETLHKLGVPPHCTGMRLARDMIVLAAKEPDRLHSVAKRIYHPLLSGEGDSVKRIEHALRYTIETAWRGGDAMEYQARLFGNTVRSKCGRPSNAVFLAVVSDHVRMELQRRRCAGRIKTN